MQPSAHPLNHTQLALVGLLFSQLTGAVVRLSTILHCLQWYKLVLRTRLSTPAVQYMYTPTEILDIPVAAYCFPACSSYDVDRKVLCM